MVTIVDYGMGNLRSVQKAFQRFRVPVIISKSPQRVLESDKLVLPGVGHFGKGMKHLAEMGLLEALNRSVIHNKTPILGICLGMQLMTQYSEEGNCEGFGWVKAKTKIFRFENNENLKIPHMGWNVLIQHRSDSIFRDIEPNHFFYFVHSFYVTCEDSKEILTTTTYGHSFVSSFRKANIYGCQFHPEKSHDAGLKIIQNFAEL